MNTNKYKVKVKDLHKVCKPSIFRFETTADLKPLTGIIGQERAYRSLAFALDIDQPSYNVYLSGVSGTGKFTLAYETVYKKAKKESIPYDWCYVYNFKKPDTPKAIKLAAGQGAKFKQDLLSVVDEAIVQIIRTLESEEYEYNKNQILSLFMEQTNQMYLALEQKARTLGFTISRNEGGITPLPIRDGEVLNQNDYMNMSKEERTELMKNSTIVQEILNDGFRQYRELEKDIKERINKLETETAYNVASSLLVNIIEKYQVYSEIVEFIKDLKQDLVNNVHILTSTPEENNPFKFLSRSEKKTLRKKYQVNLIIDNSTLKHAPVIVETNPTFANLFGQIEYEGEFGILATDFSKIKAGAFHKANGGYLILNVTDVINNYYLWDNLKRILKNQEIRIENITSVIGISNTETLQPEPIPCQVKVILIGEPLYYYLLYSLDEDFQKLFKIRADFDMKMPRTRKAVYDYARFISSICHAKNLKHFTPEAVAIMVDYGSRMAENKKELSTRFNKLAEIVYEANQWSSYDEVELVEAEHVKKAIKEKIYRCSGYEDILHEQIMKDTILINTSGKKIGEINGLAVYQIGDHVFGKPVKITAKTFMGERGIINIEREIMMSGKIHSKGVLTLNGYLGSMYAQDKPLSLSASLTFEQSYSGIEGDSASSAELYALLSSLAEAPIKQGIAVTGSVNQSGEIQPVGGVNQKIEGFFKICLQRGLNGKQGVIIPKQNVEDLLLDQEIIDSVKNNEFHIWAISHIDQGMEILTDKEAGVYGSNDYTLGSIHYLVNNKIKKWTKEKSNNLALFRHKTRKRRSRW
ncbi:MAG TPA: ATP-binding protein [Syntrophomonadaceae bacterium]|nr:ATP-binding protein [Syntrophomonadaceae bacterium]